MPLPTATWKHTLIGCLFLFVLLPAGCVYMLSGVEPDPAVTNKNTAVACAKIEIRNQLKAPSTSEFGWRSEMQIETTDNITYKINSYVDAQNSFGAMIRTNFVCDIIVNPDSESCRSRCELQQ